MLLGSICQSAIPLCMDYNWVVMNFLQAFLLLFIILGSLGFSTLSFMISGHVQGVLHHQQEVKIFRWSTLASGC